MTSQVGFDSPLGYKRKSTRYGPGPMKRKGTKGEEQE